MQIVYKVPPYSDWFMRGESLCQWLSTGRKWVYVRGYRSGVKWKVAKAYFKEHYEAQR